MVLINYAGREINAKIVYYGPGLSGKTTNLECIYASVPSTSRGKMVSMKTRQDRTLFFDFLPLELGEVHGFRTRFLLYTVPGQVFYNATRKLVLKGADAVVFVADSGLGKIDENQESLRNLSENLREQGLAIENLPFVIQYNKRDLPQVYSVADLESALNPRRVPSFEAAAASGQGVYETLHAVSRLLFQRLMNDLRPQPGRPAAPADRPVTAVAPAPPRPAPAAPQTFSQAPTRAPQAAQRLQPQPVLSPVGAPQAGSPQRQAPGRPALPDPVEPTRWRGPIDPSMLGPAAGGVSEPEFEEESARPQIFGTPSSGHVPMPPTSMQILDSVHASAGGLEMSEAEAGPEGDYSEYGHIVDLGSQQVEAAPPPPAANPPGGFIKDPLRRAEPAKAGPSRAPGRTQQFSVTLSKADVKPGGTIRIVLDLKFEP